MLTFRIITSITFPSNLMIKNTFRTRERNDSCLIVFSFGIGEGTYDFRWAYWLLLMDKIRFSWVLS